MLALSHIWGKRKCLVVLEISFSLDPPTHPFAGLGCFHPLFFAGLVVDRMLFDFFDDGFLLNSSFKSF